MPDPLTYGVWIRGSGWLKLGSDKERTFVSLQKEVAQTAATLWGRGAVVMPWDKSLLDFEPMFLKHRARWWSWPITIRSKSPAA